MYSYEPMCGGRSVPNDVDTFYKRRATYTTLPVAGRARIRALFFSVEFAIRPPVENLREQLHGFFPTSCH